MSFVKGGGTRSGTKDKVGDGKVGDGKVGDGVAVCVRTACVSTRVWSESFIV